MNPIPFLPVIAALLMAGLALFLPLLAPASRGRIVLQQFGLVAALWALTSALFWQAVPAVADAYLGLGVIVFGLGWKLVAAVGQVELRRRALLWVGRLALAGLMTALVLVDDPPAHAAPDWLWQALPVTEAALAILLVLVALLLIEIVVGLLARTADQPLRWPWLGFWLLLVAAAVVDGLAASTLAQPRPPPVGSGMVLLAFVLALGLILRRGGPFPLQGELPRGALAQIDEAVLLVDGAQRVQFASRAACDLLNRSAAQLRGRSLQRVLAQAPAAQTIWDAPLWLADKSRPDGGLWLRGGDLHGRRGEAIARLLYLQGGNSRPPEDAHEPRARAAERRWIQGVAVRPLLESALRRYGMGRQFVAAAVHVDYDWRAVQQRYGDSVLDGLLDTIAERLLKVCDWNVDALRLPDGEFVLLMADLTGIEEADKLVHRAQALLAEPLPLNGKRWDLRLRMAVVPDLRLYRYVDEWLADARRALADSRGQCVTTRPLAEQRNKLLLALEKSLLNDGIDWWGEPVLNLTTQELAGWRLLPRWTPEPEVCWMGEELRFAVAGLHMQRTLYALGLRQAPAWPQRPWLAVPLEDLALVMRAQATVSPTTTPAAIEVDRLCAETLAAQGMRSAPAELPLMLPVAGGGGFASPLRPAVLRIDAPVVLPGLADDLARQALLRGYRGAARVRDQRLFAAGVASHSDLTTLRELGVDYVSGPVIGPAMSLAEAKRFRYRPLR
ncbi:MAG: diguanylate cyclase [Oceanococcaceae bacterium]